MKHESFSLLIDLVNFDQHVAQIDRDIKIHQEHIAQLENKKKEIDLLLAQAKQELYDIRKNVDTYELEMGELDGREKDEKIKLDNVSNLKEYNSIKNEIDVLQHTRQEKEKAVLQAWNDLENSQARLNGLQKETEQQLADIEQQIVQQLQEKKKLQNQLLELMPRRTEKEKKVPEQWLEKYTLMRARVTDPVVALNNDHCSVCSLTLAQPEIMQAQKGSLLQCKGCFRLLYIPESKSEL
jgi:hypothetical protein